ncbi:cbb3-type cytochrome oxidase assembly protein CcoS [Gilvimarinus algae]|uniref:Cbb3-type cytochrome oxidase assembly protein CcoS n=1 Tax=Gilvimarinus algae TaxID=3058037 RepID=A0ABT8TCM5_9GAMM|nr:cbb3-type cytochrome oxidase assembly protein CcoS [Gilvimarinus sp. SDUM040014]MDO3381854.1 cbb3-type cytochrome oxidase assembly protein CcoS [Gilvimarinus sp. SDUM040014]
MDSLFFLIPIALIFVVIAVRVLMWAIHSGQYDNLDTEAHRILFDDDEPVGAEKKSDPESRRADSDDR